MQTDTLFQLHINMVLPNWDWLSKTENKPEAMCICVSVCASRCLYICVTYTVGIMRADTRNLSGTLRLVSHCLAAFSNRNPLFQ